MCIFLFWYSALNLIFQWGGGVPESNSLILTEVLPVAIGMYHGRQYPSWEDQTGRASNTHLQRRRPDSWCSNLYREQGSTAAGSYIIY